MEFINYLEDIKFFVLLLFSTIALHISINFLNKKLLKKANKTKTKIDEILIKTFITPAKVLLWYIFLKIITQIYIHLKNPLIEDFIKFINILPFIIIAWSLFRLISNIESAALSKSKNLNKDNINLFSRLLKIIITIIILLVVAQSFGLQISAIVTFGGIGGIVIGFAAKDMLANIFGGLMVQMDRPFSTGDWIRTQDGKIEGMVEKIGWRMTRIRTFSKNPVYVPNSIFSTIPIETPSRMTNRRIKEVIGVRYDDIKKLPQIIKEVEELLLNHKKIDEKETIRVYFDLFNASSIDFTVYAYSNITDVKEFKKMKEEILFNIADIIAKNNAEIAFPTNTIHIQK